MKENEEHEGTIERVLPNAMWSVRLESGRVVRAGPAKQLRHAIVRLIEGDRVLVRLTSRDPNRGHVTKKL